jgi:glycine/D-amino acid oxidase-like deaminating enzyme
MPHVAVIGAGVFGTWTAFHLRRLGANVSLIDAYGPGNSRSSSGDESRVTRCGYGDRAIYSRMARESLPAWRGLHATTPLFHQTGVLWLAPDGDAYFDATRRTLQDGGFGVEVLPRDALIERYPQLNAQDLMQAMLEPGSGVLMARRSVATLAARLDAEGVELRRARISGVDDLVRLGLRAGAPDATVFACGPWLPTVFPSLLRDRIRSTRQAVLYFGVPPGDSRFGGEQMPVCIEFTAAIYSIPDIEGRGFKVGIDQHGDPFDPDTGDRTIDAASIELARAWLRRRLPALADAPLVESRVCQYENTSNGDFLIDRHPDHDDVFIVGGGSGHGFKHGPAVGKLVAEMVLSGRRPDPCFLLEQQRTEHKRDVF